MCAIFHVPFSCAIPIELEKFLSEVAVICELVADYFEGDIQRTALWFKIENPALGNISPRDMIRYGRFKKFKAFIQNYEVGQ